VNPSFFLFQPLSSFLLLQGHTDLDLHGFPFPPLFLSIGALTHRGRVGDARPFSSSLLLLVGQFVALFFPHMLRHQPIAFRIGLDCFLWFEPDTFGEISSFLWRPLFVAPLTLGFARIFFQAPPIAPATVETRRLFPQAAALTFLFPFFFSHVRSLSAFILLRESYSFPFF